MPGQSLFEQSRVVCLPLLEADDNGPRVLAETSAPRMGEKHAGNPSYHRHIPLSALLGSLRLVNRAWEAATKNKMEHHEGHEEHEDARMSHPLRVPSWTSW